MIYFSVIRDLISNDCYYYFGCLNETIYEGWDLPKKLDELIITEISGGEDAHGPCLYFDCIRTQYYKD